MSTQVPLPDNSSVAPTPVRPGTPGESRAGPAVDPSFPAEELRTVATCVLGFTELLRDPALRPEDRQLYLGVLLEQAARLARLVEHLDGAGRDRLVA